MTNSHVSLWRKMTKDKCSLQLGKISFKLKVASLVAKLTLKTASSSGLVGFEKTVRSREILMRAEVST